MDFSGDFDHKNKLNPPGIFIKTGAVVESAKGRVKTPVRPPKEERVRLRKSDNSCESAEGRVTIPVSPPKEE